VTVPLLALWGEHGFVGGHYDVLAVWREYADKVEGRALPCGHYVPEEVPLETSAALLEFLQDFLSERERLTPEPPPPPIRSGPPSVV
jgi:haloacetate dehalogenase